MGEVIKCRFSLLDEGRQYTGHHRNYILESAISTCYSPEVREGIRLRESYGYLGHGRRQFAGKLRLSEVEPVKLPDGSVILTECIPSNVTTLFEIDKEGNVEHEQEILESAPGKVALGLHQSRVGGFSWATGGKDGGSMGATKVTSFHGFDYVLNPGFVKNRGFILEDAGNGATRDMILESVVKLGVGEKDAEKYLEHWVASAQVGLQELEDRLESAAIYEDVLREKAEVFERKSRDLQDKLDKDVKVAELRQKLILEASTKSTIVIPEKVVKSLLNMASEDDFNTLVGFFESAGKVDLSRLPLAGNEGRRITVSSSPPSTPEPEYGSVYTAPDFGTDNNRFSR
jgi:hypothetical protein